jgi:hypothetical protein
MESTGEGEAVSTWKSKASFDLMIMMLTRLLYLAVETDGIRSSSLRKMVAVKKSGRYKR